MAKTEKNLFSTPEGIVEVLWRDGYHAAAELIERLSGSISRDAEWKYLKAFARERSCLVSRCGACGQRSASTMR